MTRVITGVPGNADFTTGLICPVVGEPGTQWWNEYEGMFQELADEAQWLKQWLQTTPSVHIPLNPFSSGLSNFTVTVATNRLQVQQTSVASAGTAYFAVPPLPVGRKITGITAYWQNTSTTTLPTGVMPLVALYRQSITLGASWSSTASVLVGSQADTSATAGAYNANHTIALTGLADIIVEDTEYLVKFQGEGAGANSTVGGTLMGLRVNLAA